MRRRAVLAAVAAVALGLGFVMATPAFGGAPPPDDPYELSPERRAELEALIPLGFPGEYDLPKGEADFSSLVALFGDPGDTTDVDYSSSSALTGVCGGWAYSYDKDGNLIDAAVDFGGSAPPIDLLDLEQAFTSGNRFKVDTQGRVIYFGFMPRSGQGPEDHRWSIKTGGISLDKGGDPNPQFKNNAVGEVNLGEDLPFAFNANVSVEGKLMSKNIGDCVGKGNVEFIGPFFSPVGIAAVVLFGGGFLGLLFNARPAYTFKGTL